jgi:hypothetical protein
MVIRISDEEWNALTPEAFDTTTLLGAVDAVDSMRGDLSDDEYGGPPEIRTELLRLHQLAMGVFNQGARSDVAELFEKAVLLEDQVMDLMNSLEQVQETLSQLTALYPESLSFGGLDEIED